VQSNFEQKMQKVVHVLCVVIIVIIHWVESATALVCSVANETNNNCVRQSSQYQTNEQQQKNHYRGDSQQCTIYLAPNPKIGGISFYSGISLQKDELVGIRELVLPIIDANKNEYSSWHDYSWKSDTFPEDLLQPYQHSHEFLISGLGAVVPCAKERVPNLVMSTKSMTLDCLSDVCDESLCNAISCYDNIQFEILRNISVGEELLLDCNDKNDNDHRIVQDNTDDPTLEWMQTNGVCYDTLDVLPSTINRAGRGAFSKRKLKQDEVIIVSPMLTLDRSQIEITDQYLLDENNRKPYSREHGIHYTSEVVGQQILINYCYGHDKSNLLLFPLAPGVNFINHNSTPNVYIRWSSRGHNEEIRRRIPIMELLEQRGTPLYLDYVALRDINEGEEIFIDYGNDWEKAWIGHIDISSQEPTKLFRQHIGLSYDFYPPNWNRYDPTVSKSDFIANQLAPGFVAPVRWSSNRQVVTPWAFRIGLEPTIRNVLLEYCNRVGITDVLSDITKEGNGLVPGTNASVYFENRRWYLDRPDSYWRSNLQWLSPGDEQGHQHYLEALSVAGFDSVLASFGQYLNLDQLAVFHVTFIAASYSTKGYIHTDFFHTDNRAYNIIIPLLLANETDPELEITNAEKTQIGRYKYEYDVAIAVGDQTFHSTSAVDYRWNKQLRLAATVYIADVNVHNVANITSYITQDYPPADENLLLSWAGAHWNPNNSSCKLPIPGSDHILLRPIESNTK
jgi:SET domain